MLDSIRKKSDNLIYTGIIVATVAVMAFYGVFTRSGMGGGAGAAAWVNGDPITRQEFKQELDMKMNQYQSMLGGQYDEKLLATLQIPQRTLDELIQFKLLAQQADQLDIKVPDEELAKHIRSLPYFQKDGKFDAELYAKIPNRGLEEAQQRERLKLMKYQGYLVDRVQITPDELRQNFKLNNTKVDLQYAKIDFGALAAQQAITPAQVDAFLKSASESELQTYYNAHRTDFTDKAQVKLSQIRVKIPFQSTEAQKQEAKKKIDAAFAAATPSNFGEIAKKYSDDEYAKKNGVVGWTKRGTLEAQLESALDKAEVGKVEGPVETPFGYFLLLVSDKKAEVVKSLSDAKRQIAEKLVAEKQRKQFEEDTRKAWDVRLAKGESLEAELKKYKVELKKTGPFALNTGYIPNIGQADNIIDAVFELSPESPTAKRLLPFQTNYYFIKLLTVDAAKDADFAKDKKSVEHSVAMGLQTEILTKWVGDLQKKATIEKEIKFDDHPENDSSR